MLAFLAVYASITPMNKQCTRCGETKPLVMFNKHRRGLYGLHSRCKPCQATIYREWHAAKWQTDSEWRQMRTSLSTQWAKKNPSKRAEIARRRNIRELSKSPEAVRARALVNQRVRFGRMPRAQTLDCVYCGQRAQHYHHHKGYAFEFRYDVVPVCAKCHVLADASAGHFKMHGIPVPENPCG